MSPSEPSPLSGEPGAHPSGSHPGRDRRRRWVWLVLLAGALVYAADRASKAWALANLVPGVPRPFVGQLLQLNLLFNPGAAFSFGTSATLVFTIIQAVVAALVLAVSPRIGNRWWALALGLVLGGALGNLTDRLLRPPSFGYGHVTDFLALPNFPVFNVADSAVVTGAGVIALLALRAVPFTGRSTSGESTSGEPASGQTESGRTA